MTPPITRTVVFQDSSELVLSSRREQMGKLAVAEFTESPVVWYKHCDCLGVVDLVPETSLMKTSDEGRKLDRHGREDG